MIQTIITPTIHRAKQLERLNGNSLAFSLTLEYFITSFYARHSEYYSLINTKKTQV